MTVRRRLFTLFSAVSLLLFVGTVAISAWSFYYTKAWEKGARLSQLEAQSHRHSISQGRIIFQTNKQSFAQYSPAAEYRLALMGNADSSYPIYPTRNGLPPSFMGFGRGHLTNVGSSPNFPGPSTIEVWERWIPLWPAAVLFAILPLVWMKQPVARLIEARRQFRVGKCSKCFYDLTANTTGVCPECGSPIPASPREPLFSRLAFHTLVPQVKRGAPISLGLMAVMLIALIASYLLPYAPSAIGTYVFHFEHGAASLGIGYTYPFFGRPTYGYVPEFSLNLWTWTCAATILPLLQTARHFHRYQRRQPEPAAL